MFRILSVLGRHHVTIRDGSKASSPILLEDGHNVYGSESETNPAVTVRTTQETISIHIRDTSSSDYNYVQMEILSVIPGLIPTVISLRV